MTLPSSSSSSSSSQRLALFDGYCGLCDASVQWILERDPAGAIHFAPLQSGVARDILSRHPEVPEGIDSILFVERAEDGTERLYWRSRAIFRLARHLARPWRALAWLSLIPWPLTDLGYRLVAALRYRIWGKRDSCRIPTPEERERFHGLEDLRVAT